LLAASSVIVKNVLGDAFGVATSDRSRTLLTRMVVIVVAVLALGIWMIAQKTVVELLLLYYNGITQFFPGVVAAFVWKRATAWGVGLGILTGVGVAVPMAALNVLPFGMNAGFVALLVNVVVLVLVSLVTKRAGT
jgi:solute:Na+ symporter, SSS family